LSACAFAAVRALRSGREVFCQFAKRTMPGHLGNPSASYNRTSRGIRHAQLRRFVRVLMRLHDDFDILAQRDEEAEQALDGELPKFAAQHLRNIRLLNAEQFRRGDLLEPAILHKTADLIYKLRLDEMFIRIRQANIGKDVAAAFFVVDPFFHGYSPRAIRSASRKRCSISLISILGVSRAFLAFF
jgi:hypothetical protein